MPKRHCMFSWHRINAVILQSVQGGGGRGGGNSQSELDIRKQNRKELRITLWNTHIYKSITGNLDLSVKVVVKVKIITPRRRKGEWT